MAGTIRNLITMNLLYWLPTIHWPTHKTPSREGHKPTKEPRRFHRSRTKTATIGMVIVALALIAHLCHGEKLSDQRYATLRSVTTTRCSKSSSNQVVFRTPLFAMMAIKISRCWSHSCSRYHAKTFYDKPTTQKRSTSSDELHIQGGSLKYWTNIHTKQTITNGWGKEWMTYLGWKQRESVKASGKVVCHWMTPIANTNFSSQRAALKFEDIRKKFHCNEAQDWNEYLKVSARVENSHLQFLAIYSGMRVANQVSPRESQETSSIETNLTTPRDRHTPSAPSAKFGVGPGSKSTGKYEINIALGIYATFLRKKRNPSILPERTSKMEEEDAPKFVTPRKGTKNKKPTTFDGENYDSSGSDPSSHSLFDSDVDLFPFNVKENHVSMLTPSNDANDADNR